MILPMRFSAFHNEPQNALRAVDALSWSVRTLPYEDFTSLQLPQGDKGESRVCGMYISGVA